jgi:hypothetical protein|tara:strand:+ start:216 stop:554 length:339 start_codon:yes stop_codon:yes gene_type:complete
MAVVNQYKFYGKTTTAAETVTLLSPGVNETIIIKSLRVTNKSGSNTPNVTIKNNAFEIVDTQTLSTAASVEILTLPLIVEGGTTLQYVTAGTVSDGVVFGISYLNILKEKTD